jgi:hypothetical protein
LSATRDGTKREEKNTKKECGERRRRKEENSSAEETIGRNEIGVITLKETITRFSRFLSR